MALLYFILFWLSAFTLSTTANSFYRTILFGPYFRAFLKISPLPQDEYTLSFESDDDLSTKRWAIHTSSAPYDMAVMTENCKRIKKSPHLMRDLPLVNTTVTGSQIIAHTIVISQNDEIEACATIILPGQPLLAAAVHSDPIEGHIHITRADKDVRILPDLRYMKRYDDVEPTKDIITWAFVDDCDNSNETQVSDGSELGVDARTTISFKPPANYTLTSFALYRDGTLFACYLLKIVEPRVVMSLNSSFRQRNYYEPVHSISPSPPMELHIRDDCLDIATESVHASFDIFYPSVNIFGPESIMLKSLNDGICSVLRPQFPLPASTAYFIHPIIGRLTVVNTDDKILLTGELRHVFEETSSRATVQISNQLASSTGCQENNDCRDCHTLEDAAVVVGRNQSTVSLSGVLPWFLVKDAKSVIIDMQWTKVCANLTYLPHGAISAHALFKQVSPVSSPTVASIVALEYPANNYTEVLVNKRQPFSNAVAHARPLDASITSGPPCGEQNLGPVVPVFWTGRLKSILSSELNDTSVFIWFNMVTGSHSVLGTSVLLSDEKQVYCGDFMPLTEKTIAMAKFSDPFDGYIKMTQYSSSNWASGIPTQIYYSLRRFNSTNSVENEELVEWDIVSNDSSTCEGALVFNPFQVDEDGCDEMHSHFCPIGSATTKSKPLTLGSRKHMVIHDLPLTGPFTVVGRSIRLTTTGGEEMVSCETISELLEASFRWTVLTEKTLEQIQAEFSQKIDVDVFQVEIDYTRELLGTHCSIFRITVFAEDEKLSTVWDKFDVEKKKFKSAEPLDCGVSRDSPKVEAQSSPAPEEPSSPCFRTYFAALLLSFIVFHQV